MADFFTQLFPSTRSVPAECSQRTFSRIVTDLCSVDKQSTAFKAFTTGLTVFMLLSAYPLALFLSDWWHMKRIRNNIYDQRLYTTGDGMAVLWCVLAAAWSLGKVILLSDEVSLTKCQLAEFVKADKTADSEPIDFDYD